MREPNVIHYNPMQESEGWCGMPVWRNWTPLETGVGCKKCLKLIAECKQDQQATTPVAR